MAIDRAKVQKQGDAYMAAGKIDAAIKEFRKLLDDKADDFNLMNRIGDALLQAGKGPEALDMFRKAGFGYERQGFTNKAAAVYKKAHRTSPEDVDLATRLAECYRGANMTKDAIQVHVEMADYFTKKGLLKRALEEFAKVVEIDPKNLKNKIKLADLYNKEGMKDRAAEIYLEVSESLAFDQMHAEASQVLERAKAMTTMPKVYLTQSRLAIVQKDLGSAARHLREGLQANAGSPELLEALAEVEIQAKAPERALEALSKIPQLPEKATLLCERALRDMVKGARAEEGLNLFKSTGREFARRGMGDQAARIIHGAFLGEPLPLEALIQLADFAEQSGDRKARIEALSRAHVLAIETKDGALIRHIDQQLADLGVASDQISVEQIQQPSIMMSDAPEDSFIDVTEVDPLRRIQIQKLERDADGLLKSRFNDRAQETYQKILELEPTHRLAINRIADILKASGVMTKVQQHFVKTAEKLAVVGKKHMAVEMLDQAELLFPGSTRMQRRMLGLVDLPPAPSRHPAPASPQMASAPLPPPPPPGSLDPLIALDDAGSGYRAIQPKGGPRPDPFASAAQASDSSSVQPLEPGDISGIAVSYGDAGMPPQEIPSRPVPQTEAQLPLAQMSFANTPMPEMVDEDFDEGLGESLEAGLEALEEEMQAGRPGQGALATDSMGLQPIEDLDAFDAIEPMGISEGLEEIQSSPNAQMSIPTPVYPGSTPGLEDIEPLELEPLPFATGKAAPQVPMVPPIVMPQVAAPQVVIPSVGAKAILPPAIRSVIQQVPQPVEVDEELATMLSDIDFQLDYGSPEEAQTEILSALKQWPHHPELTERLSRAEETLRRFGHSEKVATGAEEHDFTHTFFDLTDVLGDALLEGEGEEMHDATNVVEKIHTVDELFNAFREGVEQQVKGDDYETHYNLGIAYKEMLLIEPAIEEFKKAMRDPERTLECCSMLSICEQAQGNLESAVQWLEQGINTPGFPPEDSIGLHYDLADILVLMGRQAAAQQHYSIVYNMDPEYREIAAKV